MIEALHKMKRVSFNRVSDWSTVGALNMVKNVRWKMLSDYERDQIDALKMEGPSRREISRRIDRSKSVVMIIT